MKLLLSPNAFKESLTAKQAARAMAHGFRRAMPDAELIEMPVADGGDGTASVLKDAVGGMVRRFSVTGPLGAPVVAPLIRLRNQDVPTDLIEMAKTSGLALVPPKQRNPMSTTTYGLGELIAISRRRGARRILLLIGGSATVDGGAGMAEALGFKLLDARGRPIPRGGQGLQQIKRIIPPPDWIRSDTNDAPEIIVACDVNNPLIGPSGAAAIFGPQKGATRAMIPKLDTGLKNLAQIIGRDCIPTIYANLSSIPGGGAAGGLGAGLVGFLGAELRPGADLVLETIGFHKALKDADLVITGEGRLDRQTLSGKAPAAVARAAAKLGIRTIGLAGSVEPELTSSKKLLADAGFLACLSIVPGPMSLNEALPRAAEFLEKACLQLGLLLAERKLAGGVQFE